MGNSSEDSQSPLLGDDITPIEISSQLHHTRPKSSILRAYFLPTINIVVLLYVAVLVTLRSWQLPSDASSGPSRSVRTEHSTLLKMPLEYEEREAWTHLQAPWNQEPSPGLDRLWNDLLYSLNVRMSPDEVEMLGFNTTNRLRVNGGDYFGVVGVYHQLHCLNAMRILMHWDYYEERVGNIPEIEEMWTIEHTDHCIDSIRQALMCNAGSEIHLADWIDGPGKTELDGGSPATCLKWDSLEKWTRPRALVTGQYSFRPGPFSSSKPTWKGKEGKGE